MFVVKRFSLQDKDLAEQAFGIRHQVFVQEQGVDAVLEYDHEAESRHYLLFLGRQAIATARWRETAKGIKLERFAVLPPFRNQGAGALILKAVLQDVAQHKKTVYLHAQLPAVKFYERHGFCKIGDQFTEAGIAHFLMQLQKC
jgi:predicted GNAT family N-acyltransferase